MSTGKLPASLDETVAVFEAQDDPTEPLTTAEVTEQFDISRRSVYDRLDRLADEGYLETKKVGAKGRIWWLTSRDPVGGGLSDSQSSLHREFRELVDAVEEYAIFLLDDEGYVRSWNPGARKIKGYQADEILDEHFSAFYVDADVEQGVPESNLETARTAGSVEDEGWRVRADGSRFWANVTISCLRDDTGTVEGFVKVTRDMSDRREQERQLRRQRDFTREILDTAPVGVVVVNADGTFETANDRAMDLLDIETDGTNAVGVNEVYNEDGEYLRPEQRPYVRIFETGESVHDVDLAIPTAADSKRWLSTNVVPLREVEGSVEQALVTIRDVSQQKRQARRLDRQRQDLERELHEVFERVDDAFLAIDEDWRITYANDDAAEMVGLASGEMLGGRVWDVFPEVDDDHHREVAERAMETQESTEFEFYSEILDIWFEVRIYPSESGLSVYFRDVSDRKESEQALARSEQRYRTIAEHFPDGAVGIYDADLRYELVEGGMWTSFEADPEELEGRTIHEAFPDSITADLEPIFTAALEEGETAEVRIEFEGRVLRVWATPLRENGEIFAGLSFAQDVTERIERERNLELYETIVSTMNDGVYVLDEDFEFVMVNESYEAMTGYDDDELLGTHCSIVIDRNTADDSAALFEEVMAGDIDNAKLEADLLRADGSRLRAESNFTAISDPNLGHNLKVGVVRDIQERVDRERELEESRNRLQTLIDHFPNGAVSLVDNELRYVAVGGTPIHEAGGTVDQLEGHRVDEVLPPAVAEALVPHYEQALEGEESTFERTFGDRVSQIHIRPVRDDDGTIFAALGMSQDITERKVYERELEQRVNQQEVVAELGHEALDTHDLDRLLAHTTEVVADVLGNEYSGILECDAAGEELVLREGVGWADGTVGEATVSATDEGSQAAYTLSTDEPVVVEDFEAEGRFDMPALLTDNDVRSGFSVVIGPWDDPWGILGTYNTAVGDVSDDDISFIRAVRNILTTAIERHEYEQILIQQRERLATLNNLNDVVHDITDAIIEQSTRDEIEETVVEGLGAAQSFEFAWAGTIEEPAGDLEIETAASGDGTVDFGESGSDTVEQYASHIDTAVESGQLQVGQERSEWSALDGHIAAAAGGTSAAVPISHEGTIYGVVTVYASRSSAFEDPERRLLERLGDVVGHAIAAMDRKRALLSDEVIELEYRIEDVLTELGIGDVDGEISLDEVIPIEDEEFIVYGSATDETRPVLDEIVDTFPHWQTIDIISSHQGTHRFEAQLAEPPVLSTVASLGGYVKRARIESGEYFATIHLPPTVDARMVTEAIYDAYPMADILAQRQVSRTDRLVTQLDRMLHSELTDKQRITLETAFQAGFFEWPRVSDGETVADTLGVSPPTFHQHLRAAERRVFTELLGTEAG